MERTAINLNIGRRVIGYMVNAVLNEESRQKVGRLQQRIAETFGDSVWVAPPQTLHITLMDWIAPLVDYGKDKNKLFKDLFRSYDEALTDVLKDKRSISIKFDTLKVTPGAIILQGTDNSEFKSIREQFLDKIELLPNTKRPPEIIHSTIVRFQKEQELQPIIDFIARKRLSFEHIVPAFRLVRETTVPQIECEIIKEYPLRAF